MQPTWTDTLAEFLKQEPGVEAVRLDPASRKVSVATIGNVDVKRLEQHLAETLAAIESQLGKTGAAPKGFTLKREGKVTELAEVSCATAPSFWKWREFVWAEADAAKSKAPKTSRAKHDHAEPAARSPAYRDKHAHADHAHENASDRGASANDHAAHAHDHSGHDAHDHDHDSAAHDHAPDAAHTHDESEERHGHSHGHGGADGESEWKKLAGFAAVCGVLGIAGFTTAHFGIGPSWLPIALYVGALIAGGWDAAVDSWDNIKHGKVDIHFLMLAVAVGAVSIGAYSEAVLLLFLFSASGAMEAFAMDRTHREVSALLKSAPKKATLIAPSGGGEREITVEEIGIGDRLLVKPGEAFPADGTVVKGKSASDESALTGEAVPVEKSEEDAVFSGTINLWGVIEFNVTRLPSESTLQKIIRLIQTAQKLRAPSERFTDKFGGGYTILVLAICAVMFAVWWLGFGIAPFENTSAGHSAFYRAMTLLVVMSPCALVLSIPSAILAAIAWGARHGVLFRGGAAIEKLAGINVVAMDKTGTLTTGELAVESYESFPPGREAEIMELALALETNSQHPLARAIVRDARARGVRALGLQEFQSITGQGVRGNLGGAQVLLGRRELLESGPLAEWSKKLPPASAEFAEVWVVGKGVIGRVLLRDQIRAESKGVLEELRRLKIRSVMLTGDRTQSAEAVAREIGIDEVRAGLTPEQKVEAIQELRGRTMACGLGAASSASSTSAAPAGAGSNQNGIGKMNTSDVSGKTIGNANGKPVRVAMVGDGVNDAPSLAAADVSVAMGARGSDAALEQAEVILMDDRIENFLSALTLSKRAVSIIRQNLAISLGVVVIMAIASTFGVVSLGLGVAAHEGSTVLVCLNSLRLLFGKNR